MRRLESHRMRSDSSVVFVAGAGLNSVRAVAEHIDVDGRFAHFVEPFNTFRRTGTQAFHFGLYLRTDASDERHLHYTRQVLRGEQILPQGPADRFDAGGRRLLVREVRGNLWLGWLKQNFPETRLIFVVRHPCAIASSWTLLEVPTRIPSQLRSKPLMEDHLGPFRSLIEQAMPDVFERQVVAWCIQYFVPFRTLAGVDHHVVFYEDLIAPATADSALGRLLSYCGVDADASTVKGLQARLQRANADRHAVVDGWRAHLTPAQIARANEIVSRFGLEDLYDAAGRPNPNAKALTEPA